MAQKGYRNLMIKDETREIIEAWAKLEGARPLSAVVADMALTYQGRKSAYAESEIAGA